MIDGIKIAYEIQDFAGWKQATKFELNTCVNIETGEVNKKMRYTQTGTNKVTTCTNKFETLNLTIKENQTAGINGTTSFNQYLTITGSLHKNHYSGNNYLPFTFEHLQHQLSHLAKRLGISLQAAILENIETGVNIPTPFAPYQFLNKNLISYKGNPFNRYNPDKYGVCLGFYCPLSQYIVEIYDKGKQHNLPENLLRFELRFLKMQALKEYGIKTLADLQNKEKVNNLLRLLITAWQDVLLNGNSIDIDKLKLTKKERLLLENGYNYHFWQNLKETKPASTYNDNRNKFKELVKKYGMNIHSEILELLKKEWQNLFKNRTNLPSGKNEKPDEFTIKIKGKKQRNEQTEKRTCLTCCRDISNQNIRSRYCSAKYVGEAAAHKCRNANSNPRNNLKKKVRRIESKGLLFDIMPFFTR